MKISAKTASTIASPIIFAMRRQRRSVSASHLENVRWRSMGSAAAIGIPELPSERYHQCDERRGYLRDCACVREEIERSVRRIPFGNKDSAAGERLRNSIRKKETRLSRFNLSVGLRYVGAFRVGLLGWTAGGADVIVEGPPRGVSHGNRGVDRALDAHDRIIARNEQRVPILQW